MKARKVTLGVFFILVGIYFIGKAGYTQEGCYRSIVRKNFEGYSSYSESRSLIGGLVLAITGGYLVIFSKNKKKK